MKLWKIPSLLTACDVMESYFSFVILRHVTFMADIGAFFKLAARKMDKIEEKVSCKPLLPHHLAMFPDDKIWSYWILKRGTTSVR